jgi:hypothetical protein
MGEVSRRIIACNYKIPSEKKEHGHSDPEERSLRLLQALYF